MSRAVPPGLNFHGHGMLVLNVMIWALGSFVRFRIFLLVFINCTIIPMYVSFG